MSPQRDAFGPGGGVLASRQIAVAVKANGSFVVDLVASADLRPVMDYTLRCEWLDADGVVRGWSQWDFTAAIGGGDISDMQSSAVKRVWYAEYPPPVSRAGIYWLHPVTGDVKEWVV